MPATKPKKVVEQQTPARAAKKSASITIEPKATPVTTAKTKVKPPVEDHKVAPAVAEPVE